MEQAMEQLAMMKGGVPLDQRDNLPSRYDSGDEADEDYLQESPRDRVKEQNLQKRYKE